MNPLQSTEVKTSDVDKKCMKIIINQSIKSIKIVVEMMTLIFGV
jgi:hypothetical protein